MSNSTTTKSTRYLSEQQRKEVLAALLLETTWATGAPILAHGCITRLAKKFGVSVPAISKIWKQIKARHQVEGVFSPSVKKRSGRPRLYDHNAIAESVELVEQSSRGTLRDIASKLGVGTSTLWRIMQEGDNDGGQIILPHTNPVLPLLTAEHKVSRTFYALNRLDLTTGLFDAFDAEVHVDEKWFYITRQNQRIYITQREKKNAVLPARRVVHKSHITKVMFLAATARPVFDADGTCTFDGKIGCWPIIERTKARRSSRNRQKGAEVIKPLNVTRDIYRKLLLEKVIPAIKTKFPRRNRSVVIQQDGARSHIEPNDEQFLEGLAKIKGTFG